MLFTKSAIFIVGALSINEANGHCCTYKVAIAYLQLSEDMLWPSMHVTT